jgi:signal transduction histidine kinase
MADSAINTVQRIASDLRPIILDTLGLAAALAQEADGFRRRTGIPVELVLPPDPPALSKAVSTAVYRIYQEALTNVLRHANARHVEVRLQTDPVEVHLQIEDDGCGIDTAAITDATSLGLLGMRERASVLGGELAVGPTPQGGTRVTLRLPRQADDKPFWAALEAPVT